MPTHQQTKFHEQRLFGGPVRREETRHLHIQAGKAPKKTAQNITRKMICILTTIRTTCQFRNPLFVGVSGKARENGREHHSGGVLTVSVSHLPVRVNYEYLPQAEEELHIKKGMTIPVITKQEDGWWEGEIDEEDGRRRRGLFPSNVGSLAGR